jgi:hypothetical protein
VLYPAWDTHSSYTTLISAPSKRKSSTFRGVSWRELHADRHGVALLCLSTEPSSQRDQGASPAGGAIADCIGYKPAIVAGCLLGTVAFVLFGLADSAGGCRSPAS